MFSYADSTAVARGQIDQFGAFKNVPVDAFGAFKNTPKYGDRIRASGDTAPPPSTGNADWSQFAGDAMRTTAATITGIVNTGTEAERARLHDASLVRIAEIQAQGAAAREPALQQMLMNQQRALELVAAQTAPRGVSVSTRTLVMVGGVVAILAAGAYLMTSGRRSNPVIGRKRSRRFVSAADLRRRRSRR